MATGTNYSSPTTTGVGAWRTTTRTRSSVGCAAIPATALLLIVASAAVDATKRPYARQA